MQSDAGFDVVYQQHKHGWSQCLLKVDGQLIDLSITHIFGHPAEEIMNALMQLIDGVVDVVLTFHDEPGGTQLRINRRPADSRIVDVEIVAFSSGFSRPLRGERTVAEFSIVDEYLIVPFYFQLAKVDMLMTDAEFAADRRGFPHPVFQELKRKFSSAVNQWRRK